MAADTPKNTSKAAARDNVGQSGTDDFATYQDEAGLTAKDAGKGVEFNHGEESPVAKAERKRAEKDDHASLGLPAQMLPENQDESVKP